jgi:hypothetical protein
MTNYCNSRLLCVTLAFILAAQSAHARDEDAPGKEERIRALVELLARVNLGSVSSMNSLFAGSFAGCGRS